MIQLNSKILTTQTTSHLANIQQKVDNENTFTAKAVKAKSEWNNKTASLIKETAFIEIKETLIDMCVGVEVCNYCENNEATDIEHIYPKSLFPERSFQWDNYLLACKTCNTGYKLDKFAVFSPAGSAVRFDVLRGDVKPVNDDSVMINPRTDNPLDFFWLDIQNRTFVFDPKLGLSTRDYEKAIYTLELLKLNERAALVAARKRAASYYIDRLERYVNVKEATNIKRLLEVVPEPHLVDQSQPFEQERERIKQALRIEIKECDHPTVWNELVRQRAQLVKTKRLFEKADEALNW